MIDVKNGARSSICLTVSLLAGINVHNVLGQSDYPDLFAFLQNDVSYGSSVSTHSPTIDAGSAGLNRPHGEIMSHDAPHQAAHSMGDPAFAGCHTPTHPPSSNHPNCHQGSPTPSVETISFTKAGNADEATYCK